MLYRNYSKEQLIDAYEQGWRRGYAHTTNPRYVGKIVLIPHDNMEQLQAYRQENSFDRAQGIEVRVGNNDALDVITEQGEQFFSLGLAEFSGTMYCKLFFQHGRMMLIKFYNL